MNNTNTYLYSEEIKKFFDKGEIKNEYKLELENCPVCNNKKVDIIFKHYNFYYKRCKKCSFVFANPRLNDRGSDIWYNSNFYNAAVETEYFQVKNGNRFLASLTLEFFEIALTILKKLSLTKSSRILDIGCGGGAFLNYLKEMGGFLNLAGIDLNEKAVLFARKFRGLNVERINANSLSTNEKYDLVISMESIEHANNINMFMNILKEFMTKNSYILITTPYNDKKATLLGGIWGDHYMAPNHINFFNLKSISLLLAKYRLEIIDYQIIRGNLGIGLIKNRLLNKRDWATHYPPISVEHGVTIPKSSNNHIDYVKYISSDAKKTNLQKSNNGEMVSPFYSTARKVYRLLSEHINLKCKTHMMIVAKEAN